MLDHREPPLDLVLDRYWDGNPADNTSLPAEEIAPDLAATVRRIHALDVAPPPSPHFASTLWDDLRHAHAPGVSALPSVSWPSPPLSQLSVAPARRPDRRPVAHLTRIAAAVVLAALIVGSMAATLLPHRPPSGDGIPLAAVSGIPATESAAVGTLELLWKSHGGPEPLDRPYGIGIAPDGAIWVADPYRDRFQILAPDGEFLENWGTPGKDEGEFEFFSQRSTYGSPYGDIAFDAAGAIYVLDTGNHRVQKFAPDRTFLLAWGSEGTGDGQFLAAGGIAVAPDGMVYVSDEARDDVQKFDADGRWVGTFPKQDETGAPLHVPTGVAVDGAGNIWVAYYRTNRIQRFDANGQPLSGWGRLGKGEGDLNGPKDVAIDKLGRVYVADQINDRLAVFAEDGRFLAGTSSDELLTPWATSVEVNADGIAFNASEHQVQAFRLVLPAGELLTP